MSEDIRLRTCCIVERDGEYLMGMGCFPRWTSSPWSAWRTRDRNDALQVAWKTGGRLMLFNPIAGQLKRLNSICDRLTEQERRRRAEAVDARIRRYAESEAQKGAAMMPYQRSMAEANSAAV